MPTQVLATKLYIPPVRPEAVSRPRLIERLNKGLHRKLTLVSATAGFGKSTLVSEWVTACERPAAWLSLDEGDADPTRFLVYLVAALQTIAANIGEGVLGVLESPQPPAAESILTALLNEIATIPDKFILVLDDYHVVDAKPVDDALTFLLEHLPPQLHLVIVSREDPQLPLSRLRARDQLTELRIADLRFSPSETSGFLNQMMDLNLSAEDVTALEIRTEGWIAGLQLAAISMQGHEDVSGFIKSFTGSHHFITDYLVEEVLQQQSESIQNFLLQTSILDRFCGPLCDAVLLDPSASGQETLEYLEQTNLFIIPLDNERCWYRYHHLFADLLRQRLDLSIASFAKDEGRSAAELHILASQWYENNSLDVEAFHHATVANDIELAIRLMEGDWMPLPFRGVVLPVLNWLKSLPQTILDANPLLWVTYASVSLVSGEQTGIEQKLLAAEVALQGAELDDKTRDITGRIAAIRATLAAAQSQIETIIDQSQRALEFLHPDNKAYRTSTTWKLGFAYELQGDRVAAGRAYSKVIAIGQASGNIIFTTTATIGLGYLQKAENQLHLAAETFRRSLELVGDRDLPLASEAHLGLARIFYQWNDLDTSQQHWQQSVQLAKLYENSDRLVACEVFFAGLKLALGDVTEASSILTRASQSIHRHNFDRQLPEVVAAQVVTFLRQSNLSAATQLVETFKLPLSQARVLLTRGDTTTALSILERFQQQMKAKGWEDERLRIMVLQAVALNAHGEKDKAVHLLGDALALAEPGGFIRIFVDEGLPMAQLMSEAVVHGIMPDYTGKLLAAFATEKQKSEDQPLTEPLSQRELEVLRLIAQGLSNHEICQRLFLALSTVKGHNRNIFDKLQVQRRTEAVARAGELGLL